MESSEVVVAGHLCLDIIPAFGEGSREEKEEVFRPGSLREIGPAALSTGGAVSNTGLSLHKLGAAVRLIGKVGNDDFGGIVRRIIAGHGRGLDEGIVTDADAGTSYSIVISRPGRDRFFLHYPGANDAFRALDIPDGPLSRARLFHFGYPPVMKSMVLQDGRELTAVFRRAKEAGVTTSLDMSLPDPASEAGRADWPAILRSALPWVDVFLPSFEEILFMLRRKTFEQIRSETEPELVSDLGKEILDMGAKIAVLKLGERGLYMRTAGLSAISDMGRARPADPADWADREMGAPCFQVRVAGTTGSGDAAIAGFLMGLLRGLSPAMTLTVAAAVGACCVEAPDALSGIRPWPETLDRIAGGWPTQNAHSGSGWKSSP